MEKEANDKSAMSEADGAAGGGGETPTPPGSVSLVGPRQQQRHQGGGGAGLAEEEEKFDHHRLRQSRTSAETATTADLVARRNKRFSQPESPVSSPSGVGGAAVRGPAAAAAAAAAAHNPAAVHKQCFRSSKKLSLPLGNALYNNGVSPKFGWHHKRDENHNHHHEDDADVDEVTRSLERTVRKISRGSANVSSPSGSRSPILPHQDGGVPSGFLGVGGLSELARGYEQYRESLNFLHPTTEYGEASSDDLSSEWDNSDVESNNNSSSSSTALKLPVSFVVRRNAAAVAAAAAAAASTEASAKASSSLPAVEASHASKNSAKDLKDLRKKETSPSAAIRAQKAKSDDDEEEEGSTRPPPPQRTKPRASGWRKLQRMVQWTPFIQTYKHRKYQWVQLAGHSGNFKTGQTEGTIMKKLCAQEEQCYKQMVDGPDRLVDFVPKFQGVLTCGDDDEKFIQLQDCLSSFNLPSIMDCKIGVRTYLEEELEKAKVKPKLRRDMYDKMIAVDPNAPTKEEHALQGVTKPRYMVWRETISSTATLGFRIEGVKMSDGSSSKDFKTTKTKDQLLKVFQNFLTYSPKTAKQYLERLLEIREALDESEFFKTHEFIGSSLLFIHDEDKAGVWLIDFGKTVPLPAGVAISHDAAWEVGNHEDGYKIGLDNLIRLFTDLAKDLQERKDSRVHNNATTTSSSAASSNDNAST